MQFSRKECCDVLVRRHGRVRGHVSVLGEEGLQRVFPHALQLYRTPPTDKVSLHDVEEFAVDRLKVLRVIERVNLSGRIRLSEEWKDAVLADLRRQKLRYYAHPKEEDDMEDRRMDCISHFVLRMAFCRTEELRRWFIMHEVDLFRLRFSCHSQQSIKTFLHINDLQYESISPQEKRGLESQLQAASNSRSSAFVTDQMDFYRVPFTSALDLVRSRRVLLRDGMAYVPSSELASIVATEFRCVVSRGLAYTTRALPSLETDSRLLFILSDFHKLYTGADYSNSSGKNGKNVVPEELDQLSKQSYPLCMLSLHQSLRANHHLRHGGRLQYGLFLKGLGLSLEDAMRFWREELTHIMDAERFEKGYGYNVRHAYGKEGKRTNYTPYSCARIIGSSVGTGDAHGCPFKHWDASTLRARLSSSTTVPRGDVQSIVDLAAKGHFQVACHHYFEATHNCSLEAGINHPNQYVEESRNVLQGNAKERGTGSSSIQTTRAVGFGATKQQTQRPKEEKTDADTMWPDEDEEEAAFLQAAMDTYAAAQ